MAVELISLGEDLLLGAADVTIALAKKTLASKGVFVSRHTAIGDGAAEIASEIKEALKRSSLIFVLGKESLKEEISPLFSHPAERLENFILKFSDRDRFVFLCPKGLEGISLPNSTKKDSFFAVCSLCLLHEKEVAPFLKEIETPDVQIGIHPFFGSLHLSFSAHQPVSPFINKVAKHFPEYFLGSDRIEEAVYKEMVSQKKTLGLAESCTGGAIAARLTTVAGASSFFAGSIVAYSNEWKQRFLGLKRDTLLKSGAVSLETVQQMVLGIFSETNVDYAVAVTGLAGPSGADNQNNVGTIYIAVGKRGGKIDAGKIMSPFDRLGSIEFTLQIALGALWRRVAYNALTLS